MRLRTRVWVQAPKTLVLRRISNLKRAQDHLQNVISSHYHVFGQSFALVTTMSPSLNFTCPRNSYW
eukprot:UN12927